MDDKSRRPTRKRDKKRRMKDKIKLVDIKKIGEDREM